MNTTSDTFFDHDRDLRKVVLRMYKRDVGILLLSVFAVYFSIQNEGPFSFRKAWYAIFKIQKL